MESSAGNVEGWLIDRDFASRYVTDKSWIYQKIVFWAITVALCQLGNVYATV